MKRDLDGVYQALVSAFQGAELPTAGLLTAEGHVSGTDDVSRAQLPFLALQTGNIDTSEWGSEDWTDEIRWTIPAQLVVESAVEDKGAAIRAAVVDLMQHARRVRGLPVDVDGRVIPDDGSMAYANLIRNGDVEVIADRKGPHISGIRIDGPFDSGRFIANLTIKLSFLMTLDPRELQRAKVAVLGVRPVDLMRTNLDTTLPPDMQMRPRFEDSERKAVGRFTEPYPYVIQDGRRFVDERFSGHADGTTFDQIPVSAQIDPASVTLAALATTQASVLVMMRDGTMTRVSDAASWGTSNAAVATVSSAGLITAVATGTATITGTFAGLSGTCAVTVS